ncbi:MAG TPA: cytochrome c oxidase subunit 3 [Longimicrobiales bacterium]
MSHAASMALEGQRPMSGIGVYNQKFGMWVFLLSEVMFFTGLIGSYIILRFAHPEAFAAPGAVLNVPLTAANTFILIVSSVTMVKAFAAIESGDQAALKRWLLATVVLGVVFLSIQGIEYYKLAEHGFVPMVSLYAADGGPLYGMTFYTLTGFHGAHVSIGVGCMIFTTVKAFRGRYTQENHGGVEVMGLYWHFVDLVWIILFTIVYLI